MYRVIFVWALALAAVGFAPRRADAQRFPEPPSCSPQDYCCGNHICDPGDDRGSCPEDCDWGCNYDTVCEPGFHETPENCPADCTGECEQCNGRCGTLDDGCGNMLECGACVAVCGNGIPEEGEDCASCPADAAGTPTFSISPAEPIVGTPVTLTADPSTINDPPPPLWDLGTGDHLSGSPQTYTYTSPARYAVRLTAAERICGTTKVVERGLTVVAPTPINRPPTADPGPRYAGQAGLPVRFDGSRSTDPDGNATIVSYDWAFGDGGTGHGRMVTHTYQRTGTFTVTLTVVDTGGLSHSASTTAGITPQGYHGRFNVETRLGPYDRNADSLDVFASMTILPPESQTFTPGIHVVVSRPDGTLVDSGLVPVSSPYWRPEQHPQVGYWSIHVEYFFVPLGPLSPILVWTADRGYSINEGSTPEPRIEGPRDLWWLGGGFHGGDTPTSIGLRAYDTQGSCEWWVEQGWYRVSVQSYPDCMAIVTSVDRSFTPDDVAIRVISGGRSSQLHYLTVHAPWRMDAVGGEITGWDDMPHPYGGGFQSVVHLRVTDNVGEPVPWAAVRETFGFPSYYYPLANWPAPNPGPVKYLDHDGIGTDTILASAPRGWWYPDPVPPDHQSSWDTIFTIPQELAVEGILVRKNTQRWFRGRGRHEDVQTPVRW